MLLQLCRQQRNFFSVFHLLRTSFSAFSKKSKCAVIDYFKFISSGERLNVGEDGEGEGEGEGEGGEEGERKRGGQWEKRRRRGDGGIPEAEKLKVES